MGLGPGELPRGCSLPRPYADRPQRPHRPALCPRHHQRPPAHRRPVLSLVRRPRPGRGRAVHHAGHLRSPMAPGAIPGPRGREWRRALRQRAGAARGRHPSAPPRARGHTPHPGTARHTGPPDCGLGGHDRHAANGTRRLWQGGAAPHRIGGVRLGAAGAGPARRRQRRQGPAGLSAAASDGSHACLSTRGARRRRPPRQATVGRVPRASDAVPDRPLAPR